MHQLENEKESIAFGLAEGSVVKVLEAKRDLLWYQQLYPLQIVVFVLYNSFGTV